MIWLSILTNSLGTGFLAATAFAILAAIAVSSGAKQQREKIEQENSVKRAEAIGVTKPNCCYCETATWLEGSHGSLRRFAFRNEKFAKLFARLNENKVVH